MIKLTVIGELELLVSAPLMFPLPLAAIPVTVTVLSLDQLYTVPETLPLNTIVVIGFAEHTVCDDGVATALGVGFTSTVAMIGVPVQVTPALVKLGVMVKVTVTGTLVVFVNVPLILPLPLAAIPVTATVLSLVQLKTVPATLPESTIVVIDSPEQIVCDGGVATALGLGFTSTVAVIGVPVQVTPALVNDGVIVKVTVTGTLVVLVSVPLILPLPLAAIPVTATVLSLVQLYTVPATLPLNTMVVIGFAEHTVCEDGVATAPGVGFTVIVNDIGVPLQVTPPLVYAGVTVIVPNIGAFVAFVPMNEAIFPDPLAARPIAVFVLVQL